MGKTWKTGPSPLYPVRIHVSTLSKEILLESGELGSWNSLLPYEVHAAWEESVSTVPGYFSKRLLGKCESIAFVAHAATTLEWRE